MKPGRFLKPGLSETIRDIVAAAELAFIKGGHLSCKVKDKQLLLGTCPLEGTIGV